MVLYNFTLNGNNLTIYKEENGFELRDIVELVTPNINTEFRGYNYGEEFEICLYERLLQEASNLKNLHDTATINLKEVDDQAFDLFKLRMGNKLNHLLEETM